MLRILLATSALAACTTSERYHLEVEADPTSIQAGEHFFVLVSDDEAMGDPPMPVPASFDATPPGIIQIGEPMIALAPGDAKLTASYDSWSASVMLHVL